MSGTGSSNRCEEQDVERLRAATLRLGTELESERELHASREHDLYVTIQQFEADAESERVRSRRAQEELQAAREATEECRLQLVNMMQERDALSQTLIETQSALASLQKGQDALKEEAQSAHQERRRAQERLEEEMRAAAAAQVATVRAEGDAAAASAKADEANAALTAVKLELADMRAEVEALSQKLAAAQLEVGQVRKAAAEERQAHEERERDLYGTLSTLTEREGAWREQMVACKQEVSRLEAEVQLQKARREEDAAAVGKSGDREPAAGLPAVPQVEEPLRSPMLSGGRDEEAAMRRLWSAFADVFDAFDKRARGDSPSRKAGAKSGPVVGPATPARAEVGGTRAPLPSDEPLSPNVTHELLLEAQEENMLLRLELGTERKVVEELGDKLRRLHVSGEEDNDDRVKAFTEEMRLRLVGAKESYSAVVAELGVVRKAAAQREAELLAEIQSLKAALAKRRQARATNRAVPEKPRPPQQQLQAASSRVRGGLRDPWSPAPAPLDPPQSPPPPPPSLLAMAAVGPPLPHTPQLMAPERVGGADDTLSLVRPKRARRRSAFVL